MVILILAGMLALIAGCTSPSPTDTTGLSPSFTLPTPGPGEKPLARYALSREDMPFTVKNTLRGIPGKADIPESVRKYGIINLYLMEYYEESDGTKTAWGLRQVICELPEENATSAFADVRERLIREPGTASSKRQIVQEPGINIGDETVAFSVRYNYTTPQYPDTIIAFRKGPLVEVLIMKSPEPDFVGLTSLAEKAASGIPGGLS